jgi:hypothetical protein
VGMRRLLDLDFSDETQQYLDTGKYTLSLRLSGRCSVCGTAPMSGWKDILNFRIYRRDGTELDLSKVHRVAYVPRTVRRQGGHTIQCKKCEHTWFIYSGLQASVNIVETSISTEEIGTEPKTIDNLKYDEEYDGTITISQEWTKSWSIEYEDAKKVSGGVRAKASVVGDIKRDIERELRSKYAISESLRYTATEQVPVRVPPRTKLQLLFHWKKILQHGLIKFRDAAGNDREVPFAVAMRVTFDVEQVGSR